MEASTQHIGMDTRDCWLTLPTELHMYILNFCPTSTHQKLSLTSRYLRHLSLPEVFKKLTLNTMPWDLDVYETVQDVISPHVRDLKLDIDGNYRGIKQLAEIVQKFRKLQVLRVYINLSSPNTESMAFLIRELFPFGKAIHSFWFSIYSISENVLATSSDISLAETKLAWEFLQIFRPDTLKTLTLEASPVVIHSVRTSLLRLNQLQSISMSIPFASNTSFDFFSHIVNLTICSGSTDARTLVNVLKSCMETLEGLVLDRVQIFGWFDYLPSGEEETMEVLPFHKLRRISWMSSMCMIMTTWGNVSKSDFLNIFRRAPISSIFVEEKDSTQLIKFLDLFSARIATSKYEKTGWNDLKSVTGKVRNTSSWADRTESTLLQPTDRSVFGFEVKILQGDDE